MHEELRNSPWPQAFTVLHVNLQYRAFHAMLEFYLFSDNCEGQGDQAFEGQGQDQLLFPKVLSIVGTMKCLLNK